MTDKEREKHADLKAELKEYIRALKFVSLKIGCVCDFIDSHDYGIARVCAYDSLNFVNKLLERKGK